MGGAACRDLPPDAFYSSNPVEQAAAKAHCFECPVQLHCLRYALDNEEPYGIWGGLLPAERKRILKSRKDTP